MVLQEAHSSDATPTAVLSDPFQSPTGGENDDWPINASANGGGHHDDGSADATPRKRAISRAESSPESSSSSPKTIIEEHGREIAVNGQQHKKLPEQSWR